MAKIVREDGRTRITVCDHAEADALRKVLAQYPGNEDSIENLAVGGYPRTVYMIDETGTMAGYALLH